ncbi:MAG TPA: hypothetical protein PLS12_10225 [Bacteroidales bacterium]|nr:hypothetical protein [Bacteroidales bacterium]
MEHPEYIPLYVYGIAIIVCIPIIVYLVIKRIRDKNNETFEKRDN